MIDKLSLLFRKLCIAYDDEFAAEEIIPSEDEFNASMIS